MDYAEFFTPEEVAIFKRVKRAQMNLATISREVVAEMVSGEVLPGEKVWVSSTISVSGKELIRTDRGLFRFSNLAKSDNSTEKAVYRANNIECIDMSNAQQMRAFFDAHGLIGPAMAVFRSKVRERLNPSGERPTAPEPRVFRARDAVGY